MTEQIELTPEQAAGEACRCCGSKRSPLHPDETIEVPYAPGVVQQIVTVICSSCLNLDQ